MKLTIVEPKKKIDNTWSIERVATECPPYSWKSVFENAKEELKDISDIIEEEKQTYRILPDMKDMFRAFEVTQISKVKVVIIGQDVYANLTDDLPIARGLSFSVAPGVPIPPSLENIFKEVRRSGFNVGNCGDLTPWAVQGVLLLNSCLTVRQSEPGSHKQVWFSFIKKVINAILEINPNCIFVAWGKPAQKVAEKFVGQRSTILTAPHPSPLSAYHGFHGCNHFIQINELLVKQKKTPIDWSLK